MADPIDIQLHIMANEDMIRMDRIFRQFNADVASLNSAVETVAGQLQFAVNELANISKPGKKFGPADNAGGALAATIADTTPKTQKESTSVPSGPTVATAPGSEETTSTPRPRTPTAAADAPLWQRGPAGSFIRGFRGEAVDSDGNPLADAHGQPLRGLRGGMQSVAGGSAMERHMQTAFEASIALPMAANFIQRAVQTPMNIARQQGAVSFGTNLGYSPAGPGGIPLLSPASRAGWGATFDTLRSSMFGLDPNYSTEQAREATSVIAQSGFGYRDEGYRNRARGALQSVYENTGIGAEQAWTPEVQAALRQGSMSLIQFTRNLEAVPDAADAAGVTVTDFVAQMNAGAEAMKGNFGTPFGAAQEQIRIGSSASGLTPAQTAEVGSNRNLAYMALARNQGSRPFNVLNGPMGVSRRLGAQEQLISGLFGKSNYREVREMRDNDHAAWLDRRDQISLQMLNPQFREIYGVGDWDELEQLINREGTGPEQMGRAQVLLERGGGIRQIQNAMGMTEQQRRDFGQSAAALSSVKGHDMRRELLQKRYNQMTGAEAQSRAKNRTMVDLTPDAKRLLTVLPQNNPHETNHRSAANNALHSVGGYSGLDLIGDVGGTSITDIFS